MSFSEAANLLGEMVGVGSHPGGWNQMSTLTRDQVDTKLRSALKRVSRLVKEHHHESMDTPYPPSSQIGEYPHRRTGDLQRSLKTTLRNVSADHKELRFTYDEAIAKHRGYYYPKRLVLSRLYVLDVAESLRQDIEDILETPVTIFPI